MSATKTHLRVEAEAQTLLRAPTAYDEMQYEQQTLHLVGTDIATAYDLKYCTNG